MCKWPTSLGLTETTKELVCCKRFGFVLEDVTTKQHLHSVLVYMFMASLTQKYSELNYIHCTYMCSRYYLYIHIYYIMHKININARIVGYI